MKGVVFTELLDLVEDKFGYDTVDEIIEKVGSENQGAYTSIGTYDFAELVQLVSALSESVDVPINHLINAFGHHLFQTFTNGYEDMLSRFDNAFDLLENVETFIHIEVRKLYPDAELPTFSYEHPADDELVINYRSERPLADLCEGLIQACVTHFGQPITIDRQDTDDTGKSSRFHLTRQAVSV